MQAKFKFWVISQPNDFLYYLFSLKVPEIKWSYYRPADIPGYHPGADLIREVDEIFSAPPRLVTETPEDTQDSGPLVPAPLPNTLPAGLGYQEVDLLEGEEEMDGGEGSR